MQVTYGRRGRQVRYCCAGRRKQLQAGAAACPDLGGLRVEQVVEQLVLTALEPLGVEAMIAATAAHVRANESRRVRWDQQIERAWYEVDLARRQNDAVDPANRLVAGEAGATVGGGAKGTGGRATLGGRPARSPRAPPQRRRSTELAACRDRSLKGVACTDDARAGQEADSPLLDRARGRDGPQGRSGRSGRGALGGR
jgi:hypothetical protein